MARLTEPHKQIVEALIQDSFNAFRNNNIEEGLKIMQQAFNAIPEPKNNWGESYEIARNLMAANFRQNNVLEAEKWLTIFMVADPDRPNVGEREVWAGKIAIEKGELEKARNFFVIADTKSKGRVWKGETDQKYFKFFKTK